MALYLLDTYSEIPSIFPTQSYNSLSASQQADIQTALTRPLAYRIGSDGSFYRRQWKLSGVIYEAIAVVNSYSHLIRIVPDGYVANYQAMNYDISNPNNPLVSIVTVQNQPTSEFTHRAGYSYYDNVDTFVFYETGFLPVYNSIEELLSEADTMFPSLVYPITYSYTNSVVTGPSEATVGDTVTVSAVPDVGYGITDASTQIVVTNNDIAVPYTWDAATNRITFTMPDPT